MVAQIKKLREQGGIFWPFWFSKDTLNHQAPFVRALHSPLTLEFNFFNRSRLFHVRTVFFGPLTIEFNFSN